MRRLGQVWVARWEDVWVKINCCWLYAINKYGYPPSLPDTHRVLGEMATLGFDAVELEGVREENLRAVWSARRTPAPV